MSLEEDKIEILSPKHVSAVKLIKIYLETQEYVIKERKLFVT